MQHPIHWWLELISYAVTIVGLPFAIVVFLNEQRKERIGNDERLFLELNKEYTRFLRAVVESADLQLMTREGRMGDKLTPEQEERRDLLFEILISIFERAFILVYKDNMTAHGKRLWQTWEDYMRYWCKRPDFHRLLPGLLEGEDLQFCGFILKIAEEESPKDNDNKIPSPAPQS